MKIEEDEMKIFLPEDRKVVFGGAKNFYDLPMELPDEELRRLVRRAVKSVPVPADLESKLRNLIRKQL